MFKFAPEIAPQTTLKLKVEVNTREHASLHGLKSYPFAVDSDHYLKLEGQQITRAMAEQRMLQKLTAGLIEDIAPLLPTGVRYGESDAVEAFNGIWKRLVTKLKGKPRISSDEAIAELRLKRFPGMILNG